MAIPSSVVRMSTSCPSAPVCGYEAPLESMMQALNDYLRRHRRAALLFSGGLDSTVATAHAASTGHLALALTIDYDQRAAQREKESSAAFEASAARRLVVQLKE